MLKSVLERIADKYRDLQIEYTINTNMTLMTEEIARFFNKFNFKVFISIDGYKKAHDKTRKYHDGQGSFEDIIKGIEIYREYNQDYFIKGFQGTIENIDEFDLQEVYKMDKYGFIEARLAPNLLGVSRKDALKKARLVGRFLDLNPGNRLAATEVYFKNMTKLINKDDYSFFFNCKGLSSYPEISLYLDMTNWRVSHLCSYVPAASLPLEGLGHDIYNPILWKRTETFIEDRIDSLFKNCLECDLAAICRGGCIYTGLDKENTLNESACAYQRELWNIYIKKVYQTYDEE
ncbi:MAG: hypothetical protein KAW12_24635 [Candidatus Aminicenantes bacterium]|nr:hypothetical protein [Candidatus Aminicenantes bacterium]